MSADIIDLWGQVYTPPPPKRRKTDDERREQAREREHNRRAVGNPCLKLFGAGLEGQMCKSCVHLTYVQLANRYYKCDLRTITSGPASDHRVSWPACARFEAVTPAPQETTKPKAATPATLDARFARYVADHPEVYLHFKRAAYDLVKQGRTHFGAKAVIEHIRFNRAFQGGVDDDGWKINNVFVSRLARKLADEDPAFNAFFEFRKLRS